MSIIRILFEVFWKERGECENHVWTGLVNSILASALVPNRVRTQLYRAVGINLGPRVIVRSGVIFRSRRITISGNSTVGYEVLFDIRSSLIIGSGVGIGSRTVFVDHEHEMGDPKRRAGPAYARPIVVGSGARISTGTMVLPGVTIGEGAVVGARSLVTGDVEPHALYVGIPARKIKDL